MEPLNLIDSAIVIGAITGTTQALKVAFPDKVHGIITVLVALTLGALAGMGGLLGLDLIGGIFYGLSTVALHTLATKR